jgi:membrane-associated phospholipid phosphatase
VIVWEEWHYPSDVLAGWCVGLGWTAALWLLLGRPAAPS